MHKRSLYQWLDPWIWLSVICVVIRFSPPLPLMKYKPISNQTHKACAYTLAIVNNLFFIDGWGVGTIPAFIHSRNLISSSCPGVQNGPYFWWMALLLMPTILPSLCTIDFSFYLFLWVPYSFLLYGDFLFLDLSNMKSFLLMLWSWSRKEFRFNLLFHPGCKKKKKSFWKDGRKWRPWGR